MCDDSGIELYSNRGLLYISAEHKGQTLWYYKIGKEWYIFVLQQVHRDFLPGYLFECVFVFHTACYICDRRRSKV